MHLSRCQRQIIGLDQLIGQELYANCSLTKSTQSSQSCPNSSNFVYESNYISDNVVIPVATSPGVNTV